MRNMLTIARHEFVTLVRRKSFLLMVFGLPLLAMVMVAILNVSAPTEEDMMALLLPSAPDQAQGYVDEAGVVSRVPEALAPAFVSYPSVDDARRAVAAGEITDFYVVPSDYLDSGTVISYSRDFNPIGAQNQVTAFRYVLMANVAGSEELASLLWEPFRLEEVSVQGEQTEASTEAVSYWLPYALLMLLFMSLTFATGWLLQSLSDEKDSRMLEVMLSSVAPTEMLAGKTIGLGAAGILQVVAWLGTAGLALAVGGRGLNIPEGYSLGLDKLLLGLLFFALGYLLYASLVAGLGALAPSLRDASQATIIIYAPLFIPLWFINSIVNQPNGLPAVIMSLVPFTAPVTMLARVVRVAPPAWQVALSVALLLLTAYGSIRLAARLFRTQTLLSGQPVSVASLRSALRGD